MYEVCSKSSSSWQAWHNNDHLPSPQTNAPSYQNHTSETSLRPHLSQSSLSFRPPDPARANYLDVPSRLPISRAFSPHHLIPHKPSPTYIQHTALNPDLYLSVQAFTVIQDGKRSRAAGVLQYHTTGDDISQRAGLWKGRGEQG